ncbi:MAG: putative Na+/H+ antiporter, partial [Verrucomicrobiota bacterium]|nr:putative Na+/H+ antiporter [Verrucomicrobiota bacterium]
MIKGACLEAKLGFFLEIMKMTITVHYLLIAIGLFATNQMFAAGGGGKSHGGDLVFPIPEAAYSELEAYHAEELGHELGLIEQLKIRASADPFNVVATIIFFFAVVHTFLATIFNKMAHKFELEHRADVSSQNRIYVEGREPVSFKATIFHFLGEVEAIFGIWLIPLL